MEERISRRGLFRSAIIAGMGVDLAYASRSFQKQYEMTPNISTQIKERAGSLASRFRFSNFDTSFIIEGRQITIKPIPAAFAETLLTLAYFDGGLDHVAQVEKLVAERGVEIKNEDPAFPADAMVFSRQTPIVILMKKSYAAEYLNELPSPNADRIIWHEFYHIVQEARDNIIKAALDFTFNAGMTLSALVAFNRLDKKKLRSRREFLFNAPLGIFFPFVFNAVSPTEQQTYVQIGFNIDNLNQIHGLITREKVFEDIKGRLFQFEEVK